MKTILIWIKNARSVALPQSILPALLASFMAYEQLNFSFALALLSVFGVILAHLGINLFDDYFDYKNNTVEIRSKLADGGFRARLAKCHYLLSGSATTKQLFIAASVFCFLAVCIGIIIFYYRGINILYLALIGAFLGFFYSAKPFCLGYRGLGELIIGVVFGPLLMAGVYYAACGVFTPSIWIISASTGLLVANIVYSHAIMDYEPDKQAGKNTFAVLIGNKKAMLVVSFLLNTLPFALIVYGILSNKLSAWYFLTFLVFPMAGSLFYLMTEFVKNPNKEFKPKFWMGPMENWDKITEAKLDWFMIRWYSARNLITFFCIIAIIASLIN